MFFRLFGVKDIFVFLPRQGLQTFPGTEVGSMNPDLHDLATPTLIAPQQLARSW
jgi:hypothetical protein